MNTNDTAPFEGKRLEHFPFLLPEPQALACATSRCRRCHKRPTIRHTKTGMARAFTLIEVMVVMGIIALLLSMLLPGLAAAREQARGVVCRSNIRQLVLANDYYADDNGGVYVPGASDFMKNLHRWHGQRTRSSEPFDSARGPLVAYLGRDGAIRQCPTFPAEEIASESGGFERGNGGYGYNNAFIGVQLTAHSSGEYTVSNDRAGANNRWIQRPAETVMFTDSGFAAQGLIEYSFCEPRYLLPYPSFRAVPSIHFRHRNLANVAWCDGHVDAQSMTFTHWSHLYPSDPKRFEIGWFGASDDNRLFDLK